MRDIRKNPIAWAALIFACLAVLCAKAYAYERGAPRLDVYFLDVGQGDAVYARTPSGKDILIDGGPSKILLRRLAEVMPWYDRSIDVVIATHPDADHIGGLPDLLRRYEVAAYYRSEVESENAIDDEIDRLLAQKGIVSHILERGRRIDFQDGAHFDVLHPGSGAAASDTNAASIVGRLSYGSTSIMLTGDAPSSVENRMLGLDPESVRAQILKVGHHGSKTSTSEKFIRAVAPSHAVISSGAGNRYGHPHRDVVNRFEKEGVVILRTDEVGSVHFTLRQDSYILR